MTTRLETLNAHHHCIPGRSTAFPLEDAGVRHDGLTSLTSWLVTTKQRWALDDYIGRASRRLWRSLQATQLYKKHQSYNRRSSRTTLYTLLSYIDASKHHPQVSLPFNHTILEGIKTHTNPKVSNQSNQSRAEQNRANLPLPEDPPVKSDFNSMDKSTVNVGSGRVESHAGTGPHSTTGQQAMNTKQAQADMSKIGREGKENLDGPPKDASY